MPMSSSFIRNDDLKVTTYLTSCVCVRAVCASVRNRITPTPFDKSDHICEIAKVECSRPQFLAPVGLRVRFQGMSFVANVIRV